MNVAGFEEALASSLSIEIEAGLTAHVASVAGLTLLKLTAWVDRGLESNKDAADLYRLLHRCSALFKMSIPNILGRFPCNCFCNHSGIILETSRNSSFSQTTENRSVPCPAVSPDFQVLDCESAALTN